MHGLKVMSVTTILASVLVAAVIGTFLVAMYDTANVPT